MRFKVTEQTNQNGDCAVCVSDTQPADNQISYRIIIAEGFISFEPLQIAVGKATSLADAAQIVEKILTPPTAC